MTRTDIQNAIATAIRHAPKTATPEYIAQQAAGDICHLMAIEALATLLPSERTRLLS